VSQAFSAHDRRGAPVLSETAARSKLRTYIVDNFLLGNADDFDDSVELMEAGILDSTAAMDLVTFIEETFAVTVDDQEIVPQNLNSIDNICRFLVRKSS
jgi:acyl carrier protein